MADARTKANAAFFSGRFFDAVRYFTDAIALFPENHNLYSYRSAAYSYLENYSLALPDACKAIQLNPCSANNYNRLGSAYLGLGYYDNAVEAYEKGLRIEPRNKALEAGIQMVLKKRRMAGARKEKEDGNVAYWKKDYETAIKCYSRAIELDNEDICYLTNRAAAYLEMGKFYECIEDCDKAVKRGRELQFDSKTIAKALTRKGTALVKLAKFSKDFKPAIVTFQKALLEHDNADTLKKLNEAMKEFDKQESFVPKLANEERGEVIELDKEQKFQEVLKRYNEAVKRKRKDLKYCAVDHKKAKNAILVESSDDDEDCVEIDPVELTGELQLDEIDPAADVVAVAWKGSVVAALKEFSHPRHLCGNFPFKSTAHERYCSKCFCFVCEIAAPCLHWKGTKGHCHMSTEAEKLEAISFFSKLGNRTRVN